MKHAALIAIAGLLVATTAGAAPCRDAHGKFIKCPPPAAATTHTTTTTVKTSNRCRDARGHFAKCGTAGTHPA